MRLGKREYLLALLHARAGRGLDRLSPEMGKLDEGHVVGRFDGDDLSRIETAVRGMRRYRETVLDGDMAGGQHIAVIVDDKAAAGRHRKRGIVLANLALAPGFRDGEGDIARARRPQMAVPCGGIATALQPKARRPAHRRPPPNQLAKFRLREPKPGTESGGKRSIAIVAVTFDLDFIVYPVALKAHCNLTHRIPIDT